MNKIHLRRKTDVLFPQGFKRFHFWFTLTATNGKILMTSETYTSKRAAINGIKSATKNTSIKKYFDHTKGKVEIVKL